MYFSFSTLHYAHGITLHSETRLLTPTSLTNDTLNSGSLVQCPSLQKYNEVVNKQTKDRQTDRQTNRQTDGRTDGRMDGRTDGRT